MSPLIETPGHEAALRTRRRAVQVEAHEHSPPWSTRSASSRHEPRCARTTTRQICRDALLDRVEVPAQIRATEPAFPVRAPVVKALLARSAPGRRRWSRWSARSEARTNDLDQPEGRCRLAMGRLTAAWGRPAFPRCSTNVMSSATTIVIGCPPWAGSAVASVFEGRPARMLAGTPVAGADRGGDP